MRRAAALSARLLFRAGQQAPPALTPPAGQALPGTHLPAPQLLGLAGLALSRPLTSSSILSADPVATSDEFEHATGIEREELEAKAKGIDPFHEAWLDAPFGTADKPVEVTSSFSERIVGVPDTNDDSIIWWGKIKEGEPPRQLVEGGEYFVLKRLDDGGDHGHH